MDEGNRRRSWQREMSKQQRHGAPDSDDGGGSSRRGVLVAATQNPWRWWWQQWGECLPWKHWYIAETCTCGEGNITSHTHWSHIQLSTTQCLFMRLWRSKRQLITHHSQIQKCLHNALFMHLWRGKQQLTHTAHNELNTTYVYFQINYIFQILIIHASLKPETLSKTSPRY